MSRRHAAAHAALVALTFVAASCALAEEGAPRDVPEEERLEFGGGATGGAATGASRIYLIAPTESERVLRSVQRDVPSDPEALLLELISGPNESEQLEEQLESALPAPLTLIRARRAGPVLTVDVNDAFTDLTVDGLRLAVAQIVTTATGIETVERVRLRIEGENQLWPIRDNELTERTLSVYDYSGLIETTQPPYPSIPSGN